MQAAERSRSLDRELFPESGTLLPLLREIGDLKRIRSAGREGSIASRLFRRSWAALADGADPATVAVAATSAALSAARLADLDRPVLTALGVSDDDAVEVQRRALDAFAGVLDPRLSSDVRDAAGSLPAGMAPVPGSVLSLEAQPRAGVTCPGKPRIVLQPPENHAEHCLVVAVYGVLLAFSYGADRTTVFLAGLSHHLHNAAMPDAGFTGEMLLGPHLDAVVARATQDALDELDEVLRARVAEARRILPNADTPEGRAFHAADTLDRVLEIDQHLVAATLTMDRVLGDMALVHEGPVKTFQDGVLAQFGLT